MAPSFEPDLEEYFLQSKLSDVVLVIKDESDVSTAQERRLPGHSMVLVAFSKYCKAKLDNWSTTKSQTTQLEVQLPVPAGQQDVAELLLKGMYQARPSLTAGLSQQLLLQLMMLADRFEVPKVMAAVVDELSTLQPQQLEWETVLQLLQLPPSFTQQPEVQPVQQLAVQRLQQQLGDLEEVWANQSLQQMLLALPCAVLKQLLQDESMRAASENTVVYMIEQWYSAQEPKLLGASIAGSSLQSMQLRSLMHLVRMRHCTTLYAGTVIRQSSLVRQCFQDCELALLQTCCMPGGFEVLQGAKSPALVKFPAWSAKPRPAARMQKMDLLVPLSSLQKAVEDLLSDRAVSASAESSSCSIMQGQPMKFAAEVSEEAGSSQCSASATDTSSASETSSKYKRLQIDVCLEVLGLPPCAVRALSAEFKCLRQVSLPAALGLRVSISQPVSAEMKRVGCSGLIKLGPVNNWADAVSALQQKKVVLATSMHSTNQGVVGPHLHIQGEVKRLI